MLNGLKPLNHPFDTDLEQSHSDQKDEEKKAREVSQMQKRHNHEIGQTKQLDAQRVQELGFMRRMMHEKNINYCEMCFCYLETGVLAIQFNVRTPLCAQYCTACAEKRGGTKVMTDMDYLG